MKRHLDVAVLSPTPTHPLDFGNRKRIHAYCRALQERGARVHFLLYPLEGDWRTALPEDAHQAMRDAWDEFVVVPPSIPVHAAARGPDHLIDEWWDPALENFLSWYCKRRPLDALIVNYVYLSKGLLSAGPGCLKVLDTHDRVSERRDRLARLDIRPEWFHTTVEQEAIGVRRADLVLAIKEQERGHFSEISGRPVLTLPFLEERLPARLPPADPDGDLRVGILGARNSINIRSATRFVETALPRFRDYLAPIRIVLAGTMCAGLEPLRSLPGVEILGPLADVRTFYESVDVVVGAVEESTGQKIRIGEALSYGVPVISHAHSFEGYPAAHPWHRLDGLDEVVDACIDLSFEPQRLAELRAASAASQARQQARVARATDTLVDRIARDAPADLFVVAAASLDEDSLLVRHVAAMARMTAATSKVLLLLEGEPNDACLSLVRLVRGCARTWATRPAPPRLGLQEVRVVETAAALAERFRVGNVWLFGAASSESVRGLSCNIVTTLGTSRGIPVEGEPTGHAWHAGGQARMGRLHDSPRGCALRIDGLFPLPYFPAPLPEERVGGPLLVGPPALALMVAPASAAFAAALARVLARHGALARRYRIVLYAADDATAGRLAQALAQAAADARAIEVLLPGAPGSFDYDLRVLADLGGGVAAFTLLAEYAASRTVPVVRLPAGTGFERGCSSLGSGALALVTQVVRAVDDGELRAALRKQWQEQRDEAGCVRVLCERLAESARWVLRTGGDADVRDEPPARRARLS